MDAANAGGRKPYSIEVVPSGEGDPLFRQREAGVGHTPYRTERIFYSLIREGDSEGVRRFFGEYLAKGIVVGRLSADALTQMKYFAVCCVTLACRSAILGGMDETDAFNFSDDCIRCADAMKSGEEIMALLTARAAELADKVAECKSAAELPPPVRKCVNYVNRNLHGSITLAALAEYCGLSAGYLGAMFRRSTGCSVSQFVTKRRLEAAKALLEGGCSVGETAYTLGFSTESHFIARFKEEFGVTPRRWRERCV